MYGRKKIKDHKHGKMREELIKRVGELSVGAATGAERKVRLALDIFEYQRTENPVYREFLKLMGEEQTIVRSLEDIPFLPVSLFKSRELKTGDWQAERVFESSGTTGYRPSRHFLRSEQWYQQNHIRCFTGTFGHPSGYCHLALLPSYLERGNSSLVAMVAHYIRLSKYPQSGFFLNDAMALRNRLEECRDKELPTILWGVGFALLDFVEERPFFFPSLRIIETGGMKGRRKEITRMELHQKLSMGFSTPSVSSEYGMTEMLSQSYALAKGRFKQAYSQIVNIIDIYDPRCFLPAGSRGRLAITDLANVDSCAFLLTDDLGIVYADGSFEISGRRDNSEVRGCSLLYTDQ